MRFDHRPRSARVLAVSAGLLAAFAGGLPALELRELATDLEAPTVLANAGDHRLFLTLREGLVVIFDDGGILPEPFLDLRDRVRYDGVFDGLYSLAFHPDFVRNGFFFVLYVDGDDRTVVTRLRVSEDPDLADPASEVVLLSIDQSAGLHDGNHLAFGPDGYLYVSTGDSGPGFDPACSAQSDDDLQGKVLRIDVDAGAGAPPYFSVPPSNPFAGQGPGKDLLWAKGLRNPWRFSFDRATGDLWIGDPGEDDREEVNRQPAASPGGENYGWKVMEGTLCQAEVSGCDPLPPACDAAEYTPPVIEYAHGDGNCAVIGGFVYRGDRVAEIAGAYLYGDFCSGALFAAREAGGAWQSEDTGLAGPEVRSFGEDVEGELYLVTGDTLYRVEAPPVAAPGVVELAVDGYRVLESAGRAVVTVRRLGGALGPAEVRYATSDGTARSPADYAATSGTLSWADGDRDNRRFLVPIVDDAAVEADETLTVTLSAPSGAALGARSSATVSLFDDDVGPCVHDATTLCLNRGRFEARVSWRTREGDEGEGQAVLLTDDAGFFWFFDADNPEIFVKVLRACQDPFNHYWVFAAGLTDVETRLTVTDTRSGEVRTYEKPLGLGFDPIRDTTAFDTCP